KLADRLKGRSSVLLIERGNQILKHFSPSLRKTGKRGLQERGVQLYLNTAVTQIAAEQVTISQNNQNQTLPVDLVIWTAGTKLGEWLSRLDCEKNQASKLIAHPTLQLRGYREVLVLGDIAEIRNGQKFMPATAQVAFQQASCAAKNLKLAMQGKKLRKFFYFHLGDMMTLGHGIGVIDSFSLTFYGKIAGFLRRLIYVQRLPTMRHRLQVLRKLLFGWQLKK
ncbi:MAG: NAD(P)/FAD-dependent oxidoreductase, partial [Cyanobacteria bacterium J083]